MKPVVPISEEVLKTRNIFKKICDEGKTEKLYNGSKTFIFHQIHVKYYESRKPRLCYFFFSQKMFAWWTIGFFLLSIFWFQFVLEGPAKFLKHDEHIKFLWTK